MNTIIKSIFVVAAITIAMSSFVLAQQSNCAAADYDCKVRENTARLAQNPRDFESYYNRGYAYHQLGKENDAIADFTTYIDSKPSNPEYLADGYDGRANAKKALARYQDALADYNAALNLFTSTIYLNNRGNCYFSMAQYANALADYDRAISIDPKDAEPYYNRAKVYSTQKLYKKAIADLNIYVELNKTNIPFLADGYQNRSLAYSNLGDTAQALKDINAAIDLDPTVASRFRNRAALYRKLGKAGLAAADEKTAADLDN